MELPLPEDTQLKISKSVSIHAQEIDDIEDKDLLKYQKSKSIPAIDFDPESDSDDESGEEMKEDASPNKKMK
jgi:hypothetical protein